MLRKKDLMKIPLRYFGLPKYRKYPMHDEKHLRSAISYFFACKRKDRNELARNIIRRHRELKSEIKVSPKNPLYRYVPDEMKAVLKESIEPLFTPNVISILKPVLEADDMALIEVLMTNSKLTDVDSLDDVIPSTHIDRTKVLNAMKSAIMNDEMEFPIMYTDFPILTKVLQKNNGGIMEFESYIDTISDYDETFNESCAINPVSDPDHVQFCALLREWNEGYVNGLRNHTYDRLMIESWKTRVSELLESYHSSKTDIKYQKLIDLGIDNVENSKAGMVGSLIDNIADKADEMGVSVDVNKNAPDNTITVSTQYGLDGTMVQKGMRANDDAEKYK